jgi:ADP-ribosylglycohydrolase
VPVAGILAAAQAELREQVGANPDLADELDAVREWAQGPAGVQTSAVDTLGAVVHLLGRLPADIGLADALVAAVSLGGDTDSVAALVGGLFACRMPDAIVGLPWADRVSVAEPSELDRTAAGLYVLRRTSYHEPRP